MPSVEILAIGNELLSGDVQDTNTHWLCRHVTGLGGRVTRAVMMGDDAAIIAGVLREVLVRRPEMIFTVGGLGPTADDMTLAAVAEATQRPLELSDVALVMVQTAYEEFAKRGYVDDAAMTESRRKMAMLPRGAEPLANRVGAAPGVLLEVQRTAIISLPGVPEELKGIFGGALGHTLSRILGSSAFAERAFVAGCRDESVLAPLLAEVAPSCPDAYIKSRARRFGSDVKILITISARADSEECARERVDLASDAVRQALESHGITADAQ